MRDLPPAAATAAAADASTLELRDLPLNCVSACGGRRRSRGGFFFPALAPPPPRQARTDSASDTCIPLVTSGASDKNTIPCQRVFVLLSSHARPSPKTMAVLTRWLRAASTATFTARRAGSHGGDFLCGSGTASGTGYHPFSTGRRVKPAGSVRLKHSRLPPLSAANNRNAIKTHRHAHCVNVAFFFFTNDSQLPLAAHEKKAPASVVIPETVSARRT